MPFDIVSILLAFIAGILSILSPCVWPLVPIVMSSAAAPGAGNRISGPIALALGLSLSFALAGSVLSFLLVSTGTDPEIFRYVAASILIIVSLPLLIKALGSWLTLRLSMLTARFQPSSDASNSSGQFFVGLLLGLVWLPCVGPTLGAAIALASMGQQLFSAFITMFVFGAGTASTLILAALLSNKLLDRFNGNILKSAEHGKKALGVLLLVLGLLVLTGVDKLLETWAVSWLPDWAFAL